LTGVSVFCGKSNKDDGKSVIGLKMQLAKEVFESFKANQVANLNQCPSHKNYGKEI